MTPYKLSRLSAIAELANNGNSWEWEHAYPQRVTRVGDVALVAECFENPDAPSRFAEFIATFDPPTVLFLLSVLDDMHKIRNGTWNTGTTKYLSAREFARAALDRHTQ